jgi:TorA maturation chaperone TorD
MSQSELAANRAVAYRLLAQALLAPSAERFTALAPVVAELRQQEPFGGFVFHAQWEAFLDLLDGVDLSDLTQLKNDHSGLFRVSSMDGPTIPPFESVFTSFDGADRGAITARLAVEYRAAGLSLSEEESAEPDDVTVELEFMAHLCLQESEAWEEGRESQVRRYLRRECTFLDEHLGWWIPELAGGVRGFAPESFYRPITGMAAAFVAHDRELARALLTDIAEMSAHLG